MVVDRIEILRGYSGEIRDQIPSDLEFCFVNGDHTWSGIDTDLTIVVEKLAPGKVVCLHDVFVPPNMELCVTLLRGSDSDGFKLQTN